MNYVIWSLVWVLRKINNGLHWLLVNVVLKKGKK